MIGALEALWNCERPGCAVEIIVVINSSEAASSDTVEANRESARSGQAWVAARTEEAFQIHILSFENLKRKHAGVGLARKIGMDEAARRFDESGAGGEGVIACFDADCRCGENYLRELERHFHDHPQTPGSSVYFEHPLSGEIERGVYQAIARYELHLRYYIDALRFAGFPYAYQTVGSSMAVRSWAYQSQGGMNKRQAGEDFYFLHKIIRLGAFTELNSTRVMPSPRRSHRVPFGTGRAVGIHLDGEGGEFETYPFQAFVDLGKWLKHVPRLFRMEIPPAMRIVEELPEPLREFLKLERFDEKLAEIQKQTTTAAAFEKRFYAWFDAFAVMKYVHCARDGHYGSEPVVGAAAKLLGNMETVDKPSANASAEDLLRVYRVMDMSGRHAPHTD